MQPTGSAAPTERFRDRSLRLALFGGIAVLVGAACATFALLQLALVAGGSRWVPGLVIDTPGFLINAMIYALLAAAFVVTGLGSIRRRRWVRSIMLTLCWTWLLGGAIALVLVPALLEPLLGGSAAGGSPPPAGVLRSLKWGLTAALALGGVLLPGAFVWVYRDRDLLATCEHHDPRASWTERCPSAVLGLGLGLAAGGLLLVPMALRPAVPLFGRMLDGWPAAALMLLFAVISVWLARSIYRLELSGWWGGTILLGLCGVSTAITFVRVDPIEIFRAMGYPPEQIEMLESAVSTIRAPAIAISVAFTVGTLLYMLAIRRHFRSASADPRA